MKIPRKILKRVALKVSVYFTVLAMLVNIGSPALYAMASTSENKELQKEVVDESKEEVKEAEESEEAVGGKESSSDEASEDEEAEVEEVADEVDKGESEEPVEEGDFASKENNSETDQSSPENDQDKPAAEEGDGTESEAEQADSIGNLNENETNSSNQEEEKTESTEEVDGNNSDKKEDVIEETEEGAKNSEDEEDAKNEESEKKENSSQEEDLSWIEEVEKEGYETIEVKEGKSYEYKGTGLIIKFTKINPDVDDLDRIIGAKEVKLTEKQIENLGALSDTAYDIISPMDNGDFEYELTLPVSEDTEEGKVEVVYAEDEKELDDTNKVKGQKVNEDDVKIEEKEVKAGNLNHFTIFVVTGAGSGGSCDGVSIAGAGDECYLTIQEAIDAAIDGDVISLQNDIDLGSKDVGGAMVSFNADISLTIDLNGFELSGTDAVDLDNPSGNLALMEVKNGDLTITDNSASGDGFITLNAIHDNTWNRLSTVLAVNNNAEFTLEGGTIEHEGGTSMAYGIDHYSGVSTINIDGGKVKSDNYIGIRMATFSQTSSSTLNVTGGIIEGESRAVWVHQPSADIEESVSINISGGRLEALNTDYGRAIGTDVFVNGTGGSVLDLTINISGGELVNNSPRSTIYFQEWDDAIVTFAPTITITDGTITNNAGTQYENIDAGDDFTLEETNFSITGGTFSYTPPVTNTTQDLGYESIQEAIDDASEGDTINVAAGTYHENFIVDVEGLTIQGPNNILGGDDSSRTAEAVVEGSVRVEADNVTVKGFYIDGTNVTQTTNLTMRGILVANTNARANVTIENNVIENWATGVSLAGGNTFGWVDGATITGNLFIDNGIGSTENVNDLSVTNNVFDNGGVGLGGGAVLANSITGNDFFNGSRYIAAASGVTADFEAMFSANTFDGAASAELITGQWYDRAIFSSIQDAIDKAGDGSAVNVAAGAYELTEQMDIDKGLSISGQGAVIIKANNPSWSTTNGEKHLIGIYGGTEASPITISNITMDFNDECYGLNTYGLAYGVLSDVTLKNSTAAGLTVNGSTIIATNLNTSDNAWGAVNVDPGSGVTDPSVFTLNSGTLEEDNQIWSDRSYVTETATVTVNADGYNEYIDGDSGVYSWTNNELTNYATITKNDETKIYSTIQSAIDAAEDGDVINVTAGTYVENSRININVPNLTLQSTAGRDLTIIDNSGVETIGIYVYSGLGVVTVDGFTVNNFENGIIQSYSQSNGTAFIVKNCKVVPKNNSTAPYLRNGIQVSGDGSQVIDNIVVGAPLTVDWSSSSIGAVNASNVLVEGNIITGSPDIGIDINNYNSALVDNITINDNHISGAKSGVTIESPSNLNVQNVYITNNTLENSQAEGQGFNAERVILTNLTVTGNEITGNDYAGIRFSETSATLAGDILINNNNLSNNTDYGIFNGVAYSVNAENNYWGSEDPDFETLVSGDVDYSPWWVTSSGPSSAPASFVAGSATANSLALSWTNNESNGSYYIIKRSTSAITADSFNSATTLGGVPIPADGGQGYVAKNLSPNTTYYFAIKLVDALGNVSDIATVSSKTLAATAVSTDKTAPAAISDLALQIGSPSTSQIKLTWTATGDDGSSGLASKYIIKRSKSEITATNFDSATTVYNTLSPKAAGSAETFTVTGLSANTTYYFAIKVQDEVPNTSSISNVMFRSTSNDLPTVSGINKVKGTNDSAVSITVTGNNFVSGTNTLRFSNADNTFEIAGTYVSATSLTASIPVGAPVGNYGLKIVNSNGVSASLSSAYTVEEAPKPLPTVKNITPTNVSSNDSNVKLTIYGNNFTGATAVKLDTGLALTGLVVASDTKITATVPGSLIAGAYNIRVTTATGTNTISSVKLDVKDPIVITSSSTEQTTNQPISLSTTNKIPAQVTLQSDETIVNTETNGKIEVVIPPETEIKKDDGTAYTGNINPPQIVKTTDEMKEEAGEDAVVITMGNPEEKISFSNDFVTIITLESTNAIAPLIWYYNPVSGLEIAGKDGVKDGINYIKGGTVLNTIVNDDSSYTYTIGLLLDHMSSYVAGVKPVIDSLSSSSAKVEKTITITGSNFSDDAVVRFGTTIANIQSLTTNSISVQVPLIEVGSYDITITNKDGLVSKGKNFNINGPDEVRDVDAEYKAEKNEVKLSWDVEDSSIYKVYIYRGRNRSFKADSTSKIAENEASDETYNDDGFNLGEKYYYKLITRDEAGNVGDTRVISITIPEKEGEIAIVIDEGIELAERDEVVEGADSGEENDGVEEEATVNDEGAQVEETTDDDTEVLGEEDENGNSLFNDWRFWLAVILIAGFSWFFYNKRINK
jgi:hypothetical protein